MPISDLQFNTLAAQVNDIQTTIDQIVAELGDTPQGVYADVRTRLDILEARIGAVIAELALLSGEFATLQAEITALQNDVITLQASVANVVTQLGTNPQGIYPDVTTRLNAMQLQISGGGGGGGALPPVSNIRFSALIENPAGVPVFNQLTQDMILPGFSASLSGGLSVEVGAHVINPVFTASYPAVPTSANITNTDGQGSPLTLLFPYTNGTVLGNFTRNTIANITFTLTAIHVVTKTSNTTISFLGRTFFGLGTAFTSGATGATASGSTAILTGPGTGTLPSFGLLSSITGQTFGLVSPINQNVYLLTPHTAGAHTFKDQNGFLFPMNRTVNAFSFTNQFGQILSYDLYQSVNSLSTPFTITVVS